MKIEIYKGVLRTSGKTDEQIKESFNNEFGSITQEEMNDYKKMMDIVDGLEVFVTDSFYGGDSYSLVSWVEKDNDKWKEFVYLAEQDSMFGTYVDEREQFDKDWDMEEYEPNASLVFNKDDVEILEKVN